MPLRLVLKVQFISVILGDFVEAEFAANDLREVEAALRRSKEDPKNLEILDQRFVPDRSEFITRYAPRTTADGAVGVSDISEDQQRQYIQSTNVLLLWTVKRQAAMRVVVPGFHLDGDGYVVARVPRPYPGEALEEYLFDV